MHDVTQSNFSEKIKTIGNRLFQWQKNFLIWVWYVNEQNYLGLKSCLFNDGHDIFLSTINIGAA